jgi:hypothetical protein
VSHAGGLALHVSATGVWPEAAYANSAPVDLSKHFAPFGATPTVGDALYLGSAEVFSKGSNEREGTNGASVTVSWEADPLTSSDAQVRWDYFGRNGWQPIPGVVATSAFQNAAFITFEMPEAVPTEVRGRVCYWVRARLDAGSYAQPAIYDPIDPRDLTRGYRLRTGSGGTMPPRLHSLKLGFDFQRPHTVLTQNGLVFADQTDANRGTGFRPFVSSGDVLPTLYADSQPTFYLGLTADGPLQEQPIKIYVAVAAEAFSGSVARHTPTAPVHPRRWRYSTGNIWESPLAQPDRVR